MGGHRQPPSKIVLTLKSFTLMKNVALADVWFYKYSELIFKFQIFCKIWMLMQISVAVPATGDKCCGVFKCYASVATTKSVVYICRKIKANARNSYLTELVLAVEEFLSYL